MIGDYLAFTEICIILLSLKAIYKTLGSSLVANFFVVVLRERKNMNFDESGSKK